MSINGNIGKLEETLKVLADIDQRLALMLARIGGSDNRSGLVSKDASIRGDLPDDLSSRFDRHLAHFMSLNESIVNTTESIDQSLGVDTGSVDRPIGYKRGNLQGKDAKRAFAGEQFGNHEFDADIDSAMTEEMRDHR